MWNNAPFRTLSHPTDVKQPLTLGNNVFGDLANQRIDFNGVQSKLQSKKNYRSDNKRLEMKFFVENNEFKDFQDCFIPNSFTYKILKDLCQKIW